MPTLNPFEAGTPVAQAVTAAGRDVQFPHQAAFIPRSVIDYGMHHHQANSTASTNVRLEKRVRHALSINIPLDTQVSLSEDLSQDGKVTELVARFESYAGYSDALKVPPNDYALGSGGSTSRPPHHNPGTISGPSEELRKPANHTIDSTVQGQSTPRKPVPSQWLAKTNGPNLATAQRARERSHKKESQASSPIEVKTLRGMRSSIDLGRAHSSEGPTFLTKEALVAVESNIMAPTSPRSPNALRRSPSKPTWKSPNASPLRSNLRQQPPLIVAVSPARPTLLSTESTSNAHSRIPSSVATSTCGNSFYTAEGSPVRSPTGSELSFSSAVEFLEDVQSPHLDLTADSESVQVRRLPNNASTSTTKAANNSKIELVKPKLALKIPSSDPWFIADHKSTATSASATSSPDKSISPWDQASPVHASRIPRVPAAGKTGSARNATQSSILKRAQSVKSLTSKAKPQREESLETIQDQLSKSPGPAPVLSHNSMVDNATSICQNAVQGDLRSDQSQHCNGEKLDLGLTTTTIAERATAGNDCGSDHPSRATSSATLKALPTLKDPVLMDSAIIYSRKQSNTRGMMLNGLYTKPPLVIMAHKLHVGTLDRSDSHENNVSHTLSQATTAPHNASTIRDRSQWYVPDLRTQAASEKSTQSSYGSDLRATAPEFVPQAQQQPCSGSFSSDATTLVQPDQTGALPDLSSLDKNGVPWLYYMYPIQFAYEQGFRNGRSKSPKKFKPRKQRESVSSPTDGQLILPNAVSSPADTKAAVTPLSEVPQRQPSTVLMPPPPVPTQPPQGPMKRENSHPGITKQQNQEATPRPYDINDPFSTQLDLITQQTALRSHSNDDTFRFPDTDLTSIRNVAPPLGPRNMHRPTYHSVPYRGSRHGRRHAGNGLYGGRGAAGVPMHATAPFPDPVAPQGRPDQSHGQVEGGSPKSYAGYTVGTEACGMVHIEAAMEQVGGLPCNTCAPDH
ncbi:Nn.00g011550.m01.CDS01 [Neocucurbitaria sp. VM-36]